MEKDGEKDIPLGEKIVTDAEREIKNNTHLLGGAAMETKGTVGDKSGKVEDKGTTRLIESEYK